VNQLTTSKRAQVIGALVEGNSINSTCRMFGVGKHTVLRLLEAAGRACAAYHYHNVRGLRVRRLQCDEIWAFVGATLEELCGLLPEVKSAAAVEKALILRALGESA
jgi:hypothetical protein